MQRQAVLWNTFSRYLTIKNVRHSTPLIVPLYLCLSKVNKPGIASTALHSGTFGYLRPDIFYIVTPCNTKLPFSGNFKVIDRTAHLQQSFLYVWIAQALKQYKNIKSARIDTQQWLLLYCSVTYVSVNNIKYHGIATMSCLFIAPYFVRSSMACLAVLYFS
jgi:hypothetical protein